MTVEISTKTVINRQQSEVWNFIASIENFPKWMPEVDSAHHLDEGELGRGSTLRFESGREIKEQQVSYWETGNRFTLSYERFGNTSERTYQLTPVSDTQAVETTVELHIKKKLHGIQLLLTPLIIWSTKRIANNELTNIKKFLEIDFNEPLTNSQAEM